MEDNEIFMSRENDNLTLTMYKFHCPCEVMIEVTDNNYPKYPLIFRISKRCKEEKMEEMKKHLLSIVSTEFPNNTWVAIN